MTVTDFLGRLQRVKKQSGDNGWLASCPFHGEDKTPSLSVKEGSDGRILVNCFAGCSADDVLSAMGLDAAALFPEHDKAPARTVVATYDYRDEQGNLLFQKVRYSPKGFTQRVPDGKGGWTYGRQGARPILYKLYEFQGKPSVLFVEGEKDVDAAWALGIPATCNPDGSGQWDASYPTLLTAAGVLRVAVIPDHDAPGRAHALRVAAAFHAAGIQVRLVELPGSGEHGDLSDYLARGGTKADLLAIVKATAIWTPNYSGSIQVVELVAPPPRLFEALGEQRYRLGIHPEGVTLEVNRLRRSSQELVGELLVRVNGSFVDAKTFADGILQVGDMNFSSTQARTTRAKLLGDRSGDKSMDWFGFLEEFVTSVIAAERKGRPAEVLADVEVEEEETDTWRVEGFPLLRQLPQVVFGSSATGKSYFSMWIAGQLADQGVSVLYADWEFSQSEHKKRLVRLFPAMPRNLFYIRCEQHLRHETDHLLDVIQKHKIQYIICDSIGFACEGPADAQEGASGYFRSLRQLKVGSLNIAHIPKQYDDNREAQIFGSVFFTNGARSVWFIDKAKENPTGELRFGLYHRKNNVGALLQPKGYKLIFRGDRTLIESINLKDVEELAAGYPLLDRIKELLLPEPMTMKAIAEELNVTMPVLRATVARHKSQFIRMGNRVAVSTAHDPPPETSQESSDVTEF